MYPTSSTIFIFIFFLFFDRFCCSRDGKIASEGLVEMAIGENNRDFAFAVEICCETDFVARGSSVAGLASECTRIGVDEVKGGCANDELLEKVREGTKGPVEDAMRVTGEKVTVRRVWGYQKPGCYISGYLHSPSGLAKVAAIVALESENEVLGSKLAVQVAAMNPKSMEDLLEQPFGAWGTTAESVAQILSKEKSKLASFGRLEVGEGIEHKEDDFVEQVQAAMKQ